MQSRIGRQVADLLFVVLVHKPFDRFNRCVHHAGPEQSGQRTGQPTRDVPHGQQPAAVGFGQPCFDLAQVRLLGRQMTLRKGSQRRVPRKAKYAVVRASSFV